LGADDNIWGYEAGSNKMTVKAANWSPPKSVVFVVYFCSSRHKIASFKATEGYNSPYRAALSQQLCYAASFELSSLASAWLL
jgi:hypothetical protein